MSSTKNKAETEAAVKATAPRPCSDVLPIIPSRYALMPKETTAEEEPCGTFADVLYDKCPTKLDKKFNHLKTAAYTIRTLRPGFIYAYDEALNAVYFWESDGEGNFTSRKFYTIEDYSQPSNIGTKAPNLNLNISKDSNAVYLAYTQDLWSTKGVKDNIAKRDTFMTKISVPELMDGSKKPSTQEHILPSDTPEQWIEEYKTDKDGHKQQFSWSCHQAQNITAMSNLKTLATSYPEEHQAKLPVFISLYDNIAVARDQGLIAALHLRQLAFIKDKKTSKEITPMTEAEVKAIPAEMLLDVHQLNSASQEFYRKKMIAEMINTIMASSYPSEKTLLEQKSSVRNLQHAIEQERIQIIEKKNGRHRVIGTSEKEVGKQEATLHALSNDDINENVGRFTKHIKMKELLEFTATLDAENIKIEEILAKVLKATADHANILETMEVTASKTPKNLVSTLNTYDRDNVYAATSLEQAFAFAAQGIGVPVPSKIEVDERTKLLDKWVEDESSPLFMGLNAFNPYKEKLDSLSDSAAGIGAFAEELHKLFPYALGTNIIVTEITAHTYRKMPKETRWNRSKSVVENVNEAIKSNSLKKLVASIQARYAIVGSVIQEATVTKQYLKIIDTSIGAHATRTPSISGTRTVDVLDTITTTRTELHSVSKTIKSIGQQGIPAGVAFFHSINLLRAAGSFSRDDSTGNSLNLSSALFGFAGAFSEVLAKTTQKEVIEETAKQSLKGASAKVVRAKIIQALTSSLATKIFGYGGAFFEAAYNAYEGATLGSKGDTDAALYSFGAAATLGAAGVIMTMAATGALASSAIPVAGWVAGAVLLIIAGIAAIYMKMKSTDRPLEVWVSRTIFGERREIAFGLLGYADTKFVDLSEELTGYYNVTFGPRLIESPDKNLFLSEKEKKVLKDTRNLLLSPRYLPPELVEKQRKMFASRMEVLKNRGLVKTGWDENFWNKDQAHFTFLLPAYNERLSKWDYQLDNYDEDGIKNDKDAKEATQLGSQLTVDKTQSVLKKEGMYVYLSKTLQNSAAESVRLIINYWPNGYTKDPIVQTFYMDE